jgi:hypothetical protein
MKTDPLLCFRLSFVVYFALWTIYLFLFTIYLQFTVHSTERVTREILRELFKVQKIPQNYKTPSGSVFITMVKCKFLSLLQICQTTRAELAISFNNWFFSFTNGCYWTNTPITDRGAVLSLNERERDLVRERIKRTGSLHVVRERTCTG